MIVLFQKLHPRALEAVLNSHFKHFQDTMSWKGRDGKKFIFIAFQR